MASQHKKKKPYLRHSDFVTLLFAERQGLSVEPRVVSNFQSSCFVLPGLQACTSRPIEGRDLGQCLGSADRLWIMNSFLSLGLTQIALNVYPV